jgi:hypothetical protein
MSVRLELRAQVRKVLAAHPDEQRCAVCLASELDEAVDVIADTLAEVERLGGFRRNTASCATCGHPRIVIGAA